MASGRRRAAAILSRGYARTLPEDGVVVVSAPAGIRADLARAGDEPLMLARQLPGVPCWSRAIATSPDASPSITSASPSTPGRRVSAPAARSRRRPGHRRTRMISTRARGRCRPAGCARRRTRWPRRTRCWRPVRASACLEVSTGPLFTLQRRLGDPVVTGPVSGSEVPAARCAGGRRGRHRRSRALSDDLAARGWTRRRMRWSSGITIRIHAAGRRAHLGGDASGRAPAPW